MENRFGRQRVLIVDDTPDNIRILMETLRDDYAIQVATSGESAVRVASSEIVPDIILLDVMMPGIDGYAACARLKEQERTRHIPVIFITALSEEGDEARGLDAGAVDFITKPFNPALVKARVRNHLELKMYRDTLEDLVEERTRETVIRLVLAADARDTETGAHIRRIRAASSLIAMRLGWSAREAEILGLAATMHDIGKIGIPDRVLLKEGRLDEDEWEIMRGHAELGARNLQGATSRLLQLAGTIARTHHERWDGRGYPKGLKGEEIPLAGRIVGLVDVFDALTSCRPYKEAWPVERALAEIRKESGRQFDPRLVDIFLEVADEITAIRDRYSDDIEAFTVNDEREESVEP